MKSWKVFGFIASVIALLAVVALVVPEGGFSLFGMHLRFPSLRSVLSSDPTPDPEITAPTESPALAAMSDSLAYLHRQSDSSNIRFWLPSPDYFDDFWLAASHASADNRTLRILHYGDSQIEMDHITSRLRSYMQSTFGGGGPGMLPFHPTTPTLSVRQRTQGHLTHLATFGDSLCVRSKNDYGPMMQSFRLQGGDATVTVKAANSSRVDSAIQHFSRVRLIANNKGANLKADFTDLGNKKPATKHSSSERGIVALDFQADSLTEAFRLQVAGTADLYALLVDAGHGGVAVDNIPMRGCSGHQFTQVTQEMLSAAYDPMDVGLIIMQFGGNSVPYIHTPAQVATYCKAIGKQIDHVHAAAPQAKILFIGPSDMSKRIQGEMQTYPALPMLVDSLIATANAHNAAYWSIFHAMGGLNSMPVWTRQGLAGKDYIHFSQKGADFMGDRLAEAFHNNFSLYQLEQRIHQQRKQSVKAAPAKSKKATAKQTKQQKKATSQQKKKGRKKT